MSEINATQLLAQLQAAAATARGEGAPAEGAAAGDFAELLTRAIDHVNAGQQQASRLQEVFETGAGGIDVAQVMIAAQKANIEFQFLVQVRNKLINAYQEIMNMQI